jgi:hypothetical protein
MLATSDKMGYDLAKGLGLTTKDLASLKIEFNPGSAVVITATYYTEEPTLVEVLEPFQDVKQYILVEVTNVNHS